jgi:hypothetical protein
MTLITIVLGLGLLGSPMLYGSAPERAEASLEFKQGVEAYRSGDYAAALGLFENLHQARPEAVNITYYLAITEAQLGRFQQAKTHYNEIITLDPNGRAAKLAQEGLKYLPAQTDDTLDLPPKFNATESPASDAKPTAEAQAGNGMTMQEMMAMQAMIMQMGGPQGNTMNPMMMMMPFMQNNGAAGGMDPAALSTMLQNQMLQNMDMFGKQDDDR